MSITQFTMEEVRCFGERQTFEIRPLTFFVGENSTGKTTALACFHVLADYLRGRGVVFNGLSSTDSHPYSMGTFRDIVRSSRKKEKAFKLGFVSKHADEDIQWTIEFVEKTEGIEPVVSSITIEFADGTIVIKTEDKIDVGARLDSYDEKQNQYRMVCEFDILNSIPPFLILSAFNRQDREKDAFSKYLEKKSETFEENKHQLWSIWDTISVFSTSPVRSRPKRTYDPTREFNDPEGSDIPMYLTRIEATQKENWEMLKEQLIDFGKSSGLFQNIKIKKLGRSLGAPFQLQFKVRGPTSNIIDVGYGVSQILPILVQILSSDVSRNTRGISRRSTFSFLQQPEVHLHPKAQAEFSSLLIKLASRGHQSFIVETHSDYMIDRARVDIMRGNIRPEDVSLIYFEPKGRVVKVHNISFDKMANLIGAPTNYREFFLKESKRLMGFKD
ncbi:ATP-binding protein [Candidatus Poribacteria bacterium]|nr:ATP-binding protein [Candidatus Poribacteria bacterium]